MNNEEKIPSTENEEVEVINTPAEQETNNQPAKKLSVGVIGAIIGGAVALIIAIVLMIVLIPGANNGNDDKGNNPPAETKVNYTITVVDQNGTPIKGVQVTFSPEGAMEIPFKTDANGVASYKTDKETKITVTSVPTGYEYAALNQAQSFDENGKLTVTVTELPPFVIRVVDQDGNAVAGVKVQMCSDAGSCRIPVTTDENGEATYKYEEGVFHAQLTELPDGYTVDIMGKSYDFVNGVAVIEIKAEQ